MNAKDAWQLVISSNERDENDYELQRALFMIKALAERGYSYLIFTAYDYSMIKEELKKLGYRVTEYSTSSMYIDWNPVNDPS